MSTHDVLKHDQIVIDPKEDPHFVIDIATREVTNPSSKKAVLIQGDHNSERFSFDIPKTIEGHDVLDCTNIQVHFWNKSSSGREDSTGVYPVRDAVLTEDGKTVTFSWLVSQTATKYEGKLFFSVMFYCVDDDDHVTYRWGTQINNSMSIVSSLSYTDEFIEESVDNFAEWERLINNAIIGEIESYVIETEDGVKVVQPTSFATPAEVESVLFSDLSEREPGEYYIYSQVDTVLDDTSENPVQNKVIASEIRSLDNNLYNVNSYLTIVETKLDAHIDQSNGGGTNVEVNPEEEATEDLKTIKVGETVFGLPKAEQNGDYGLVKFGVKEYGLQIRSDGVVAVSPPSKAVMDNQNGTYQPITSTTIAYATKQALINPDLSVTDDYKANWTDEERAAARDTLGVTGELAKKISYPEGFTPSAGSRVPFFGANSDKLTGLLRIEAAPVSGAIPRYYNYKVEGVDNPVLRTALPQEDTDCANKKYVDDNFVDKQATPDRLSLYAINTSGETVLVGTSPNASNNGMVPVYNPNGNISVLTPTSNKHAANKEYVDDELAKKLDKPETPAIRSVVCIDPNGKVGKRTLGSIPSEVGNGGVPMYYTANTSNNIPTARLITGTPQYDGEAANKKYVDDAVANAGGGGKTAYMHIFTLSNLQGVDFYRVYLVMDTAEPQGFSAFKGYDNSQEVSFLVSGWDYDNGVLNDIKMFNCTYLDELEEQTYVSYGIETSNGNLEINEDNFTLISEKII